MIKTIRFVRKYRCFKEGEAFSFGPGVNLLVGDQGCGKSSLLFALRTHRDYAGQGCDLAKLEVVTDGLTEVYSFDFEKDNPRARDERTEDQRRFMLNLATRFQSHGQFVNALLRKLPGGVFATLLMDEPDMALSIRSVQALAGILQKHAAAGCQIITSAHNPLFIQAFPEVLSLEHRRWMTAAAFVKSHLGGGGA